MGFQRPHRSAGLELQASEKRSLNLKPIHGLQTEKPSFNHLNNHLQQQICDFTPQNASTQLQRHLK